MPEISRFSNEEIKRMKRLNFNERKSYSSITQIINRDRSRQCYLISGWSAGLGFCQQKPNSTYVISIHQRHGQTDRQTDGQTDGRHTTASPLHCYTAWSGKNKIMYYLYIVIWGSFWLILYSEWYRCRETELFAQWRMMTLSPCAIQRKANARGTSVKVRREDVTRRQTTQRTTEWCIKFWSKWRSN